MAALFRKNGEESDNTHANENSYQKTNMQREEKTMNDGNVTNLTSDVEIKGTIKFNNILKIDGKFQGELITNDGDVIVGKTGAIKANVKVKNAIIEGEVDGNVIASEKVELKQNAKLIGDLKARTLLIEEGVVFVGNCNVNPAGFDPEKVPPKVEKTEKETVRNEMI